MRQGTQLVIAFHDHFVRASGGTSDTVTRSPEEITKAAADGGWNVHHDGF
ncbi:hypothetical protein [Streptomyces sp. ITFR-6]|nr:hypothetical protein [Streptomyces sp. ITFR-6]WNI28131.1 hypothetical protein RLT59_04570 [Streptomyces sp. ITFR-6]